MNNECLSAAVVAIALSSTATNVAPVEGGTVDLSLRLVFLPANNEAYELGGHNNPQAQDRKRIGHAESVTNKSLNSIGEVESRA